MTDLFENNSSNNCRLADELVYVGFSWIIIVELILGLPLNITVLYTFIFKLRFCKANKNMVFLFNLVLSDFLMLACLPLKVYQFQRGERCSANMVLCKVITFTQIMNRGASITFMTIISIDRYLNVVHPQKKNILKVVKQSPILSVIIWLLLLLLAIPVMVTPFRCAQGYGPEEDEVMDILRQAMFFTKILVPFVILAFCTARIIHRLQERSVGDQKKLRRAIFAVTSVVVVFSFCFLPCVASKVFMLVRRRQKQPDALEIAAEVYDGIFTFSQIDCLLDPLVYCFYSSKFKNMYLSTFFSFLQKKNKQHNDKKKTIKEYI
ncbi:12-(S)-hydroxy-5,8,10,14-eicosatetraenoic acid receptor-like [Arapaima gigas]